MQKERKQSISKMLDMIMADAEEDIKKFEGKAFTARNVSTFNGQQNAMIKAMAKALKEVIEDANT